ncbi:MAG TPA: M24 family metallopeptidase [Gaiellaceae bacterium]|nr:M24 family metallopeptidase [Gaiellaceae bacterium]
MSELGEKRRRLHAILDGRSLDAIVLSRPANIAWYSGGGRTHILATPEVAVCRVVVSRDGDEVVTAVNEAGRLESEELAALDASFRVVGWDEDLDASVPRGDRIGSDSALPGTRDVALLVEQARRALTPDELERFAALGADVAEVLTETIQEHDPASTEQEAAARTARSLLERAVDPIVLLVAGAARLPVHRHPLPTASPLGRLAMVVACGRRAGLIASITRFVSFGALPAPLADAQERLLQVDVALNGATRAGARVGEVFAAGARAYGANGFGAEEWRLHHQGGPTGYEPRDYLASAASDALVEEGQAFAWNPSVPSLKCEDTIVATNDLPLVLTVDRRWPVVTVGGLARPLVLER